MVALLVMIGLDVGRFGWSHVPWPVRAAALLGFAPAFGLPVLASRANPYLASTVRIQDERGHAVVSAGPYAFTRHPMYAGMILYDMCVPLLLDSWGGLAVSGVMILLVMGRTALEYRTLQAELLGYREDAARVRYSLGARRAVAQGTSPRSSLPLRVEWRHGSRRDGVFSSPPLRPASRSSVDGCSLCPGPA